MENMIVDQADDMGIEAVERPDLIDEMLLHYPKMR
jgi:hypothetical protein